MSPRIPLDKLVVAGALGSAWLLHERRAKLNAERLAAALLETLLFAIDANDEETGGHVRRVARYALILAEAADFDEHGLRTVERVALFHDIGKIHGALHDVMKEVGALTPEERRAIATHPKRGAEVLSSLAPFYPELPEGVLAHHERWDGTGYPRGLAGTAIPLTARVVAIADTFDVVTHGRQYSAKKTIARAREIMIEGRGTQFDPTLLDLFLFDGVFADIEKAVRECRRLARNPTPERRNENTERLVPDVTFRWRSEAPGRPRRDLVPRTRHG